MSLGNDRANKAGKHAAQNKPLYHFSTQFLNLLLFLIDIINYKKNAPQCKKIKDTKW